MSSAPPDPRLVDPSPSLRAQLVRLAFVGAVRAVRRGAGGLPDPDAPFEELKGYALRMRAATESLAARAPDPRHVRILPLSRAPGPGRLVVADVAREGAVGAVGRSVGEVTLDGEEDPFAGVERVVLHLHGGVYCLGSSATHRGLGARLSEQARAAVLLPDYRLAPEHPFPAALDDALAAYRWLLEDLGVPPARIAVTGDSAGGGLGASLLVRARELGLPQPACFVGLSPWTDLTGSGPSIVELADRDPWLPAELAVRAAEAYAGQTPLDDPAVSPLYADLTGLPPVLVHVGGDEILLDDAVRFVEACRAHGVDASVGRFPGLWHIFAIFPGIPEARHSLREIGGFIRRHTAGDPAMPVKAAA